ncbi:MAG: starch synthase, partial [Alphaproteobacteria bacterium]
MPDKKAGAPAPQAPLRLLFAASECYPLIKTGGLADVVGALPIALMDAGADVRVLLPGFPSVLKGLKNAKPVCKLPDLFGADATLLAGKTTTGLHMLVIDAPHLYDVPGNPYMDGPAERAGNDVRFAALAFTGARLAQGLLPDWMPDVVHAHDWQAGLIAPYLVQAGGPRPKLVFTIHNLAFQGLTPAHRLDALRLSSNLYHPEGLEYWGQVNYLKAAVSYSDHVTTVSPTYAMEIQTRHFGMGLDGLMARHAGKLSGIVNGIDTMVWNPEAASVTSIRLSLRAWLSSSAIVLRET